MSLALKFPRARITLDEFFALPDEPDGARYELVDGALRAMAPASATHGLIQGHAIGVLRASLRRQSSPCRVVAEGSVIPRASSSANVRVPDILVTCSKVRQGQMTFDDPVLIIEILSPTNEQRTRDNVRDYATIPSVREILILSSTRIEAELLRKQDDGAWPAKPVILRSKDRLELRSVNTECEVDEFYDGTSLID